MKLTKTKDLTLQRKLQQLTKLTKTNSALTLPTLPRMWPGFRALTCQHLTKYVKIKNMKATPIATTPNGLVYAWQLPLLAMCPNCYTNTKLLIQPHSWDCENCGAHGDESSRFYNHLHP